MTGVRLALRRAARRAALALALGVALVPLALASGASSTPSPGVRLLTCTDTAVVRPTTFIVSCADANTRLTETHWSSWTATRATGTTDFAMNLCNPNCASSRLSYFPHSTVVLSRPAATSHGRLFSLLTVRYRRNGTLTTFRFSWKGDPSF